VLYSTMIFNEHAEIGLLACCITDESQELLSRAINDGIKEDAFWSGGRRAIWKAMVALFGDGQLTGDAELIYHGLPATEVLAITRLIENQTGFNGYLQTVKDRWIKRRLARGTMTAMEGLETADIESVLATLENLLIDLRGGGGSSETPTLAAVTTIAWDQMEEIRTSETHDQIGLKTGLLDLDKISGGFKPGDMVVIAARPSMGKTSAALKFCISQIENQCPGVIYSIEMKAESLATRLICMMSKIRYDKFISGHVSEAIYHHIVSKVQRLKQRDDIWIEDKPKDIMQIRAHARMMKMRHNIKWICIDYLQLIPSHRPDGRKDEGVVSEISASIKHIAKELDIPVIVLAQLNREVEKRTSPKPRLSDLRESGSIEQDADQVIFIAPTEQDFDKTRWIAGGKMQMIVAKQRNGPVGEVDVMFVNEFSLFENYSTMYN